MKKIITLFILLTGSISVFSQFSNIKSENITVENAGLMHNKYCKSLIAEFEKDYKINYALIPPPAIKKIFKKFINEKYSEYAKYADCCPDQNGGGCTPKLPFPKNINSNLCNALELSQKWAKNPVEFKKALLEIYSADTMGIRKKITENKSIVEKDKALLFTLLNIKTASTVLWAKEFDLKEMAGPIVDADVAGAGVGAFIGEIFGPVGVVAGAVIGGSIASAGAYIEGKSAIAFDLTPDNVEEPNDFSWTNKDLLKKLGLVSISFPKQKIKIIKDLKSKTISYSLVVKDIVYDENVKNINRGYNVYGNCIPTMDCKTFGGSCLVAFPFDVASYSIPPKKRGPRIIKISVWDTL